MKPDDLPAAEIQNVLDVDGLNRDIASGTRLPGALPFRQALGQSSRQEVRGKCLVQMDFVGRLMAAASRHAVNRQGIRHRWPAGM
jgi:hypothetical protein